MTDKPTPAEKAMRVMVALDKLSEEYNDRPDVQHAIGEFLTNVGPSQLALLHDLVTHCETRQDALDILSGARPRMSKKPCPSCDGTGKVEWTSPPHRGDQRYSYNCCTCNGTGKAWAGY